MAAVSIANVKFKEGYARYLYISLYAAISIHFILFYFFPAFEFRPYVPAQRANFTIVETVEYDLPKPPPEVAQPSVPFVTDDPAEASSAASVAPSSFTDTSELPNITPVAKQKAEKFYPFDENPVLIKAVTPEYPELAREIGIEGTVLLKVLIDEKGKVISASIIDSEVTSSMEQAALAAVMRFRFEPARQRMKPVKAAVAIPIRFTLH